MVESIYVSRTGAAEILGVSKNTIINWEQSGKLVPSKVTDKGKKLYSRSSLYDFLREHKDEKKLNYRLGYFCVSRAFSDSYQKYQIKSAVRDLGVTDIIYDTDDGNYSTGLEEIMNRIETEHITELVLIGDVRLSPVTLRLLDAFCKSHNVECKLHKPLDLTEWSGTTIEHIKCTGSLDEQELDEFFLNKYLQEREENERYEAFIEDCEKKGIDPYPDEEEMAYQRYLKEEEKLERISKIIENDEDFQQDQLQEVCKKLGVKTVEELIEKTGDIDWRKLKFV